MTAIYFTEEHERFRKTVRDFMEKEVAPRANEWEAARRIPKEIWRRLGENGLLGVVMPEDLGGTGADVFFALAFLEELPRSLMGGFCGAVSVQQFIVPGPLLRHGTPDQKKRFLVPSVEGRAIGAIAISEPDTGSDVSAIRTVARREGSDWVLDGAKTWITNGVHADYYVVACKTDPALGAHGISLLAFSTDRPGIRTSPLRKMGWHASDTAEIVFENVRVPADSLVGREGKGFAYILETFAFERIVSAAISVGSGVLALETTLSYMERRQAFGRPLSRFQALRHRLADLFAELSAARQLTYHAAWLHQTGRPAVAEAAKAKLVASELAKRIADECLQFHGGFGWVEEYGIERFYRDARIGTIVAGTSEIMREIVAKAEIDGVRFPSRVDDEADAGEAAPAAPAAPPAPAREPAPPEVLSPPRDVEELFAQLPKRFRPERAEGFTGRFHFRFTDSPTPDWTLVIGNGRVETARGHDGAADCVVTTTEKVYLAIEAGTQNPQSAFLTGKVKVSNVLPMLTLLKCFRRVA